MISEHRRDVWVNIYFVEKKNTREELEVSRMYNVGNKLLIGNKSMYVRISTYGRIKEVLVSFLELIVVQGKGVSCMLGFSMST